MSNTGKVSSPATGSHLTRLLNLAFLLTRFAAGSRPSSFGRVGEYLRPEMVTSGMHDLYRITLDRSVTVMVFSSHGVLDAASADVPSNEAAVTLRSAAAMVRPPGHVAADPSDTTGLVCKSLWQVFAGFVTLNTNAFALPAAMLSFSSTMAVPSCLHFIGLLNAVSDADSNSMLSVSAVALQPRPETVIFSPGHFRACWGVRVTWITLAGSQGSGELWCTVSDMLTQSTVYPAALDCASGAVCKSQYLLAASSTFSAPAMATGCTGRANFLFLSVNVTARGSAA